MSQVAVGQLIAERYRLEAELSRGGQGVLWRASDQLAGGAPMVVRQLGPGPQQQALRQVWGRLQGVLHPQVPRFGALIEAAGDLWLPREWQEGRTYADLQVARRQRQLVFGAGEVVLLLRQLLPVLAVLHSQDLIHGDLTPANLLRRERDGLPVLLDFGLVRGRAIAAGAVGPATAVAPTTAVGPATVGVTPGYGPPELVAGAPAEPWMDLYGLGVVALVLLSGEEPAALLDPVSLAWRWPANLDAEPALAAALGRLLTEDPAQRFASAGQALAAIQQLAMPESTGPVARADRTVVLVPQPLPQPAPAEAAATPTAASPNNQPSLGAIRPQAGEPQDSGPDPGIQAPPASADAPSPHARAAAAARALARAQAGSQANGGPQPEAGSPAEAMGRGQGTPPVNLRARQEDKEAAAEGRLWPVVLALVLSAVVGTALGWLLLGRGKAPNVNDATNPLQLPASLPPTEVDQRQQLLNRLRALQIDRGWFLKLVDASLLAQYPERGGRLPSDSLDDAPLRKVWNGLAEEWISRVEQLPLEIRTRLGSFSGGDWDRRQSGLVAQGLSSDVLQQLVSGSSQNLLPGRSGGGIPPEPFRQLWYAAAEQVLGGVQIQPIQAALGQLGVVSAEVAAGGARLFPIRLPPDSRLVLGVNGSPLMQMTLFGADGSVLEGQGPLRVVSLVKVGRSPVQLLVTNTGVAPAMLTLSLRADPGLRPAGVTAPVLPPGATPAPGPGAGSGATPGQEGAPPASPTGPSSPPAPPAAPTSTN
jgi:serine/threonine-protein kinase